MIGGNDDDTGWPVAKVSGPCGTLLHGYQVAATLGKWRMQLLPKIPRSYRLTAKIDGPPSAFWMGERPLRVELHVAGTTWCWDGVEPHIGVDGDLLIEVPGLPRMERRAVEEQAQ
mgnify:CR=1 FL=1